MLADKGFSKPVAFACLDRIKGDFEKFFNDEQIKQAKPYGLNGEFQGSLSRAWVNKIKILFFIG